MSLPKVRVLVVDDSAINRFNIEGALAAQDGVEVVGRARNGEEALQIVMQKKPDAITLDLEMPKMDGFTFLRILMAKQPTPVIVVSSYGNKETVFRALELGAIDFVARSEQALGDPDVMRQIAEKVQLVRSLRQIPMPLTLPPPQRNDAQDVGNFPVPFKHAVVIASSTGGPTALLEIFSRLPSRFPGAILIAQHMPDRFTRTFAERLDKRGRLHVTEAKDGDLVVARRGFVCPGGQWVYVRPTPPGKIGECSLEVTAPLEGERYAPSADLLMTSAAEVFGARTIGVILTGMGDDGAEGARAIRNAGGRVIVESERTAAVFGMPGAAIRADVVDEILGLPDIAAYLAGLGV